MALTPMHQVLLTLRFYALGTMLISVADMFGVSISSTSRTVKNVSYAIAGLSGSFIKIPVDDINETRMKMFKIARFPLVFGAIDCTHVRIQSPGGEYSEIYRNRKG
jgi:nuclease HARBI1